MCDLPKFLRTGYTDIRLTENLFDDPKEIGFFSIDEDMVIKYGESSAKRYYYRQSGERINPDLNEGYDKNFKLREFSDEKIDNVLNWIIDAKKNQLVLSDKAVGFVTSRGTVSKLLCTPFCKGKYDHWRICASKFRNTIYLVAVDTEEKTATESNPDENYRRKVYWGKKFEQYLTTKEPNAAPDLTSKCFDPAMFCIIGTNRIGDHTLLFRAEMDALKSHPEHAGDTSQYIELKTCHIQGLTKYPYFPLKIWSQCIVVGVQDIACGFRDDSGIVRRIEEHKTAELPKHQRAGCPKWSPEACFDFCNYFLNFLRANLKDDYKSVLRFDYTGRDRIYIRPEEDEKYRIIPDHFVEKILSEESVSKSVKQGRRSPPSKSPPSKKKKV